MFFKGCTFISSFGDHHVIGNDVNLQLEAAGTE
jgi:hypothetical protein